MRVTEAGPWWDEPPATDEATLHATAETHGVRMRAMELALLEVGGVRIRLQTRARRALKEAGIPVTRSAGLRGAYRLLVDRNTTTNGSLGGAA